jgi:signal transduction histidine kinase
MPLPGCDGGIWPLPGICPLPGELNIIGDRDAIKQVLLILLDNALNHSDGAIELTAEAKESRAVICVRDYGEVIPEA